MTAAGTPAAGHRGQPVLYVLKRFPRLSETFVLRELLALEACGESVLVDVLLPAENGPRHPELARLQARVRYLPPSPRLRELDVAVTHARLAGRAPLRWARAAVAARREGRWTNFLLSGLVAARAQGARARHLHAHFAGEAAEVARDAASLAGTSVTVTAHAKDIFHEAYAPLVTRRLGSVSAVVTVSAYNVRHLRAVLPRTPVVHVPNPIDDPGPVARDPEGPVLCVARLVPKKGIDVLVDAMATLARSRPGTRLEVAGDGPLRGELEERARRLGIGGWVRFLGPLSSAEVDAAYRRCSLVALPCRITADGDRDGLPTVLLEAMVRGLPVVTTDVAGIPEVVHDGRTGLVVAPDDPSAMAGAIERLLDDPDLAARLGGAARAAVVEDRAPRTTAGRLQLLFGSPR